MEEPSERVSSDQDQARRAPSLARRPFLVNARFRATFHPRFPRRRAAACVLTFVDHTGPPAGRETTRLVRLAASLASLAAVVAPFVGERGAR